MILKEQNGHEIYSDGVLIEQEILEIAKKYPEELSQDYISSNSDYMINNTFSLVRQNILNWYPFRNNAEILEIGAGMGSLTGLLCDRAKFVTSVEMSESHAEVIRARYPERKNLEIICEDINHWKSEKKYDYVIFIGMLEYAAVFSKESNPFEDFLKKAKSFLKDDGILLFAIENRFGLKYWVGGSEDHLQEPFIGLEGYQRPETPKTFSKNELSQMLMHVGLENHRFYYLFPDYKFPEVICTDDFAPNYSNLQKVSFTYSKNSVLTVDEKKLYKDIVENEVWPFFANSFLIEAGINVLSKNPVIHVSSKGEAKAEYKVSTVIRKDGNVYKVPMHKKAAQHIQSIYENTLYLQKRGIKVLNIVQIESALVSKMYNGLSAQKYFCRLLEENDRETLFEFLEYYRSLLLRTSELSFDESICRETNINDRKISVGPVLKKGFIDLTFYNAFYDSGELIFYDQEWCFENIPLNFILYYSIKTAYVRAYVNTSIRLAEIWNYLGLTDPESVFDQMEDRLWAEILYRQTDFYGNDGCCNRYSNSKYTKTLSALIEEKQLLSKEKQILFGEKQILSEEKQILSEEKSNLLKEIDRLSEEKHILMKEKDNLINEKDNLLHEAAQLKQTLFDKEKHIQQLLPAEQEYKEIINSKMFKIMRSACALYDSTVKVLQSAAGKGTAFVKMLGSENTPRLNVSNDCRGLAASGSDKHAPAPKSILVIDHYVPQYDKDAGSKTTFQYLKMFVKQGYLVKFIGDNFYPHEPYTTQLQQMGIEVLHGPWYAEHWQEWIKSNCNNIDYAYLNRPHIAIKYIDFLKKETNIKCIYYGHDLHFLRLRRESDLTGDREKLRESQEWMEKELYIMRKADMNYFPSCVEIQEIHHVDANIPVKAISAYIYDSFREQTGLEFSKRKGIMFVGSFGHPPNEDAVLWFVQEIYPLILKNFRIPFYIVGSNPTEKIRRLADENIIVKGYVSEEELQNLYDTCKLAVVPLRYGAGVKGKVVEALYYGLPMVTTSVGIEGIENAEKIVRVADSAEDFAQTVLRLYRDDTELSKTSETCQKYVKNHFSLEAAWNIIKDDFQ